MIELGAIVCLPNGEPKCGECPARKLCRAHQMGIEPDLPVKKKQSARRVEERTVFIFRDGETAAVRKRPGKGLLAGMYELPNVKGRLTEEEALDHSRRIGLAPIHIRCLGDAKHIFSHVEWHMTGYLIRVDELENSCSEDFLFVRPEEVQEKYPVPAAFEHYTDFIDIRLGQEKYRQ